MKKIKTLFNWLLALFGYGSIINDAIAAGIIERGQGR